jgi:multidrug efflux pump subunit AcrB
VEAAARIVQQTMWPLFGATVVAVLAFAGIGLSQDSTGEYCRSLFLVILYSLMMSWVLAITVTPLLGTLMLKSGAAADADRDPYGGLLFRGYRALLDACLRGRYATIFVLVVLLGLSVYAFGFVKKSFFPDSTRPQFMVHYWLPQGTYIRRTESDIQAIEEHLLTLDGVTDVSSFVGQGALRFLLTYTPEEANEAYGMMLVSVDDYRKIVDLIPQVEDYIGENYVDAQGFCRRFVLGPGDPQKIQARFRGPDRKMLRALAAETEALMWAEPTARDVVTDWRQRVPLVRPVVAETQARNAGVTRSDIAKTMASTYDGVRIGVYREEDKLLPIVARSPEEERGRIDDLQSIQIWSPVAKGAIPIRQVVLDFETVSEDSIIRHRNRLPTLTVKCDPAVGMAADVFETLRPKVEAVFERFVKERNLAGYSLEWGGEYEDSGDAQAALAGKLPAIGLLMVLVVICLFNNLRQPLIIFLTVPLAIIGVTAGLLGTSQPFGFMALLGFMSLAGMLIKNAIVLIDEVNSQIREGKPPFQAVLDSGVSRVRPVSMAALTTVLGMIPLLADAFFVAMAVTIMVGLTFATVLTLIVVPVLYVTLYRVPSPAD